MPALFTSRDTRYRRPVGAQPAGQAIHYRVRLPRDLQCSACFLLMQCGDEPPVRWSMFWAGMDGDDAEWWECDDTPARPGVYWYWFELDTAQGRQELVRRPDATARLEYVHPGGSGAAPRWQLTVYDPDFVTPDWLAGGVMYQIFPDRFCASGRPKEGVPADRILHENWDEPPVWQPDVTGRVRNNDYFGGDLAGIAQKLPYLASLGVTCLYLNPIFEAHSNHRYDTADYQRIDPLLGTREDFEALAAAAREQKIRLVLDGVFSHTGADSVYFNREGRYGTGGAAQSPASPYASWYRFSRWPDQYAAWWGFDTLPEVNEDDPGFAAFINGSDGIVRRWLRAGAAGWRLDVADELPDGFIEALRAAAKAEDPEALVLGEVWEDASNKRSYGQLRRYLWGHQLDTVMNYPFRTAILDFVCGGEAGKFMQCILDIVEQYPPSVLRLLMNHLGTHDTERVLTALAGEPAAGHSRDWQAAHNLSPQERAQGLRRLRLATALQYTLPGVPCIYYGDEAGMEGYRDPFNRACYPWGREDTDAIGWYRALGRLRRACPALREGRFVPLYADRGMVAYERIAEDGHRLLCVVNTGAQEHTLTLPPVWVEAAVSLGQGEVRGVSLHLPAESCALLMS